MPIYEYVCSKCKDVKSLLIKYENRDEMTGSSCCECNNGSMVRMIADGTGFKMKGYSERNGYSKGDKR